MVAVEKNQPVTAIQRTRKRCSEVVEGEISSIESFCSTSQFLTRGGSLYVIAKASAQKEEHPLLHKLAFSLSVVSLVRMWQVSSTDRGVVKVSRYAK